MVTKPLLSRVLGVGGRVLSVVKKTSYIWYKPLYEREKKKENVFFVLRISKHTASLLETLPLREESPHPIPYPLHPLHAAPKAVSYSPADSRRIVLSARSGASNRHQSD